jgi:phycobilisome core-membrane linker protein
MDGMNTRAGVSQATLQRTAALYRGNAAINPSTEDAI